VVKNVTRAFQLIHEAGVIHGDVRRENILVRRDDSVVIVDFESGEFEDFSDEVVRMEDEVVEKLLSDLEKENDSLSEGGKVAGEDLDFFCILTFETCVVK
jgi:tRNA A-37 threonylcarbamoyl transferase component Bud32